jgi:3-isopropylmalate/(R)-2-methylmalate dehydratase large subunit
MFGVGATDMAGVLVTGETWVTVPGTIRLVWNGELARGVCAKDMMLYLCAQLGMGGAQYQVVEYSGDTVQALPMHERMTLANMAAELGAQCGVVEPDQTTVRYIEEAGGDPGDFSAWRTDPAAPVMAEYKFEADSLTPQVAAPHSPANASDVKQHVGKPIQQAYIGACTGAKLADLHMAAAVLTKKRVANGLRLLVAPASTRTTAAAAADGTLAALTAAGAILMPSGCGACAGYGAGVLADNEVCIASTARNFKGRMGAPSSEVYLASPYTVAASAVTGQITDPRELLGAETAV